MASGLGMLDQGACALKVGSFCELPGLCRVLGARGSVMETTPAENHLKALDEIPETLAPS